MATLDLVSAGETNWATQQNANLTALNTELIATTAKANAAQVAADLDDDTAALAADSESALRTELNAAYVARRIEGAIPAGVGWPAAYDITPTIEIGWDGTIVGSVGVTAEELFNSFATALSAPERTVYVNSGGAKTIDGVAWGEGSSGNDGLSAANPKKTISGAINAAITGAPASAQILVAAGTYDFDNAYAGSSFYNPTVDIAFVAVGGRVEVGPYHQVGTPSLDGTYTNCYAIPTVSTSTSATRVINRARVDADGVHPDYPRAASLADCDATPGTWWQESTTVYIHRDDDAPVTLANTWLLRRRHSWLFQTGINAYIGGGGVIGCGFDIIGGRDGGNIRLEPTSIPAAAKVTVITEATLSYAGGVGNSTDTDANALTVGDNYWGLVACFNVRAVAPFKDAFNLHKSGTVAHQALLTVNCSSVNTGRPNTAALFSSCNGWTLHNAAVGIDVAGDYRRGRGGVVHNINTSKAYMLGTRSADDAGDILGGGSIPPTQFKAGDTAQLWLEACTAANKIPGAGHVAAAGAAIRLRNDPGTRLARSGPVTTY